MACAHTATAISAPDGIDDLLYGRRLLNRLINGALKWREKERDNVGAEIVKGVTAGVLSIAMQDGTHTTSSMEEQHPLLHSHKGLKLMYPTD